MSEGLHVARELAGAAAELMVTDTPAAILAGAPAPAPPPGTGGRGGLFRRRGRRR
jgi:hypothetical protein